MLKKIAVVSDHASPLAAAGGIDSGGQNIYVAQVARHLARQGWQVDVFTRRDSPAAAEVVHWQQGVRVIHVPAGPPQFVRKESLLPTMPDFAAYMAGICAREGPYRLIHANFFMSGLVALILKRELGIPFVMTFHALGRVRRIHQPEADEFPRERVDIEQTIIEEADAIIAECPQDERDLLSLYRADARKICIIPCGFDAAEFWPIPKRFARKTLGLPETEPLLLNIGRMVPRKGVDNAIRALGRLRASDIALPRLMVVGGNSDLPDPALTPEIARLQALAQAEQVAGNVVFAGRRSRELLKLYYSAADLFITTPWYEPFGITPLEAMACGTPVIGSEVGGIKYSVVNDVTGRLVPARDPDALATAIAELYRQPQQLKDMGRNAMRRVNRHFTWNRVALAIASLYARVAPEPVETVREHAPMLVPA